MHKQLLVLLAILLSACSPAIQPPSETPAFTETPLVTATQLPTLAASPEPTVSSTPDPYYNWSNEYLRSRTYGGGQIEFLEVMDQNAFFHPLSDPLSE